MCFIFIYHFIECRQTIKTEIKVQKMISQLFLNKMHRFPICNACSPSTLNGRIENVAIVFFRLYNKIIIKLQINKLQS